MCFDMNVLQGRIFFITGATGLIGSNLIKYLIDANESLINPIKILALVRNIEKAKKILGENENIIYIEGNVLDKISVDQTVDYIVHAASQTSSKLFVTEPVETITTAFIGTQNILELARQKQVESIVYLSTMEVYGAPATDERITELHGTNIDTMMVRSSYPESKRVCEVLCTSYHGEYRVPVKVLRLTQTFGRGVSYSDERVFAEFARCVIENRNIVLHTKGETKRNYLYTGDAITAILTTLVKGENGQAYNAANEATYCTIYEMAQLVAQKCANNQIDVVIEEKDESVFGFAPTLRMNLDSSKLRRLGWKPKVGLEDMLRQLILDMQMNKNN